MGVEVVEVREVLWLSSVHTVNKLANLDIKFGFPGVSSNIYSIVPPISSTCSSPKAIIDRRCGRLSVRYFLCVCCQVKGRSHDKESVCNAGDSGSIPVSGRSAREGIGHPLQSSWASLVAHLVKSPPAM